MDVMNYLKHKNNQRFIKATALVAAFLLAASIIPSFASTTSTVTATPTLQDVQVSLNNCPKRVSNYNVAVPFGDSPWNIPACNIPVYNNSDAQAKDYGSRIFNYGNAWTASSSYFTPERILAQKGQFDTHFGLGQPGTDYSTPIYHTNSITNPNRKFIMICDTWNCLTSNLEKNNC